MRRSHHAISPINIVVDSTTGEPKLPHRVSPDGYYNGRLVIQKSVSASDDKN
jgi:large subunit ribosomal protein L32